MISLRLPGMIKYFAILVVGVAGLHPVPADSQKAPNPADCWVRGDRKDLELRASPLDSASISIAGNTVKVCYGRPRKLGRPIMGRLVPFGEPWRLGADEATSIYLPARGSVAGVSLSPGLYSLYAIPGENVWHIVVNAVATRWGVPIDSAVIARDIGRATVPSEIVSKSEDLLRMHFESVANVAELVIQWDRTRVRIPVRIEAGS